MVDEVTHRGGDRWFQEPNTMHALLQGHLHSFGTLVQCNTTSGAAAGAYILLDTKVGMYHEEHLGGWIAPSDPATGWKCKMHPTRFEH